MRKTSRIARLLLLAAKCADVRALMVPRYPVRDAGDTLIAAFSVAVRAAFAAGRKKLPDVDVAVAAVEHALEATLPALLKKGVALGGTVAAGKLRVSEFRAAAKPTLHMSFDAKHPRAIAWAKKHAADLVTEITKVTRERLRAVVVKHEAGEIDDADFSDAIASAVGGEARAEAIARTESMIAAHQGQREAWSQAVDKGLLTGDEKRVWIVTDDELLCPICDGLDGEEADLDGLYAGEFDGPPAHPNCLLPGAEVSGQIVAGLEANYSGPAIEIKTRRGNILRVTPNHQILTSDGWIAALEIRQGMQLFSQSLKVGDSFSFRRIDDYESPALVEDVVKALRVHGSSTSKVGCLDLHGDAGWVDGDVDIVGVDRKLREDAQVSFSKESDDFSFPRANSLQPVVVSPCSSELNLKRVALPTASLPEAGHLSDDLGSVGLNCAPLDCLLLGRASQWDIHLPKAARENVSVNSAFVLELQKRSAGQVEGDEVANVRNFEFSGQVFELQSKVGWIIAQNIVISNCRCTEGLA